MPPPSTGDHQTLCSVRALTALDFRAPELETSPRPQGGIEESPQAVDMREGTPQALDVGIPQALDVGDSSLALDVGVHPGLWM